MSEQFPSPQQAEAKIPRLDLQGPEVTEAFAAATIYAKVERAIVRQAVAGEVIESIMPNGHVQTFRTAVEGDLVLTYASTGEQVIQPPDVFASRWEATDEDDVFRAKGLSRIMPNPLGQPFITETDWGTQINEADCLLACVYDPDKPYEISVDRYGLGREVFERSFMPAEQVLGHIPGQPS